MKLVDTSSWVEYLRENQSSAAERIEALVLNGEAAWCDVTLVELWNGVRGGREKRELAEMEKEIEHIPVDAATWKLAAKLALHCRENGFSAPVSDIVIAACAATHGLDLEHCDKHFADLLPWANKL